MKKVSGRVYMIISPIGKVYIGSTTKTFEKRWQSYYNLSCKWQRKLLNSLKFYGPENHKFYKLWEGDIKDMLSVEAILGRIYNVLDANEGLNCKLPKESDIYYAVSEETRNKISESNTGKKMSNEARLNMSIERKARGLTEEQKKKLAISRIGRKWSEKSKENAKNRLGLSVLQLDLQGNFIKEFKSIKDAERETGISSAAIVKYLKGKIKEPRQFKWKYKNN